MSGTLVVQNLQGPASGANANKIIVPAGQTLYAAGHVIQVQEISGFASSHTTTSSATYAATGYQVTITPNFSTSKILLMWHCLGQQPNGVVGVAVTTIYRGGTNLGGPSVGQSSIGDFSAAGTITSPNVIIYVDEPNTTSAVTYTIYGRNSAGSGIAFIVHSNASYSFIAQEIAQ